MVRTDCVKHSGVDNFLTCRVFYMRNKLAYANAFYRAICAALYKPFVVGDEGFKFMVEI